ncbi:MAG: methylamine utilization protein [Vicinamibacteria bacterium]|nr:methylamine utilization protein [Vicinamibacteria bacterium]
MHVTLSKQMTRRFRTVDIAVGSLVVLIPAALLAAPATVRGVVTAKKLKKPVDIVVSLEAPGLEYKPPTAPVKIDNVTFKFIPRMLAIVPGTTVRWINGDPEPHNVYSPEGRYNLGNIAPGKSVEHRFDRAGIYTQLCNIHPDGLGYVVVLETPYFDVTDATGRFEIKNVAPGNYTLAAWSEKLDFVSQKISVSSGQTLTVNPTFKP